MFDRFLDGFLPDSSETATPWAKADLAAVTDLDEVLSRWGGASFNSGLYRVHSEASSRAATAAIKPYLQQAWNDAIAFAFDWLGRNFAISPRAWSDQNPLIYLVDLGEGSAFEIPTNIADFHNAELVEHADDALAADWFSEWREAHGGIRLEFNQCVGYRTPLFLGGTDNDDNLEVVNTDVYWTLTSQMYGQVKGLPDGTPIAGVSIEPPPRSDE